jgi:hypothetical protein
LIRPIESASEGVLGTLVSEVKIHTTFIGGKKRFRSRDLSAGRRVVLEI